MLHCLAHSKEERQRNLIKMESNLKKKVNNIPRSGVCIENTDEYYCEIDMTSNDPRGKRQCPGCAQDSSIEYKDVVSTRQHLVALLLCFCW